MSKPMKLVLLYGGKSGEHEVSLISAASVLANLDPKKFDIIPVGMDKEGRFFRNEYKALLACKDQLPVCTDHSIPLPSLLRDGKFALEADVVFPVVHGPLYEDGCLQGLLELANIAYVGSDVLSSAIGMDKDMARRVASTHGVQSAQYRSLSWHAKAAARRSFCEKTARELGWPLFVKPCSLGSSVGIHKTTNMNELMDAVSDALRYDKSVLVEAFIKGREIELAVLENLSPCEPPRVSVAGEIRVHHPDGFYSYSAKYLESDQTELLVPAPLTPQQLEDLQQLAATLFTSLKCKGMARVDFFLNEETNTVYFNEINTLPGFTAISMYPKLWQTSGIAYPDLLLQLVELALIHQRCKDSLVTNYL